MSSISAAAFAPSSPLQRLQSQLATQVSSGAISSTDQAALSSALTDIDTAMRSGGPKAPGDVKAKIDGLIENQVSSGKLTDAQAAELKDVFAKAFEGAGGAQGPGGPGGAGGGHGPRGAGGGGEGAGESSSSTSTDPADANGDGVVTAAEQAAYDSAHPEAANAASSAGNASGTSTSASDASKLMSDFLKLLQDASGSAPAYGASGGVSPASAALVLNVQA